MILTLIYTCIYKLSRTVKLSNLKKKIVVVIKKFTETYDYSIHTVTKGQYKLLFKRVCVHVWE